MAETHRDEIAKLEALYAAHPEGRVFTHLAEAYRKAGDLTRAKEILETGLTRHADYSSAHVVLGRVLIDLGDTRSAAASFRRVLELDHHNLVALRTLGEIASREGRTDEALGYYRDLLSLDPTDERLRLTVARLETQAEAPPVAADEPAAPEPAEQAEEAEEIAATADTDAEPGVSEEEEEARRGPLWPDDVPPEEVMPTAEITFSAFDSPDDEPETGEPLSVDWSTFPTETAPAEGALAGDEPPSPIESEPSSLAGEDEQAEEAEAPGAWQPFAYGAVEGAGYEAAADSVDLEPPADESEPVEAASTGPDESEIADEPAIVSEFVLVESFEIESGPIVEASVEEPDDEADVREAEMSVGTTDGEVLTVTMAELYANQGIYDRAAEVYRSLLARVPDDPRLREGLAQMESRVHAEDASPVEEPAEEETDAGEAWLESVESAWTGGSGVAGHEETPYAWADTAMGEEAGGPPVGEYFGSLLRWRPATAEARSADVELNVASEVQEAGEADEVELEAGAVEAAFEEWFGPEAVGRASEEETESAAEAAEEADADLEMFRSWLQSLKK